MGCVSRQGQPPAHACLRVASVGPCGMRACGAGVLIPHTWLLIGFCCYNCTPGVFRVPYKYARLASVHTWTCSCSERSTTTVEGAPPPETTVSTAPSYLSLAQLRISPNLIQNLPACAAIAQRAKITENLPVYMVQFTLLPIRSAPAVYHTLKSCAVQSHTGRNLKTNPCQVNSHARRISHATVRPRPRNHAMRHGIPALTCEKDSRQARPRMSLVPQCTFRRRS